MAHSDHFLKLYNKQGNLTTVMISAELWGRGQKKFEALMAQLLEAMEPTERDEPLQEWEEFKAFWDFPYPFEASVHCNNCHAETDDWTKDPQKKFRLRSAQLGGLVVFSCNNCGSTVRKKHFKDHSCFEVTKKEG